MDVSDLPLDFSGKDLDGLEITLTDRIASLTGTVLDQGQPSADCSVLVFAEEPTKWTFPSR